MQEKEIELRSEEVQEILTRPPHVLVRWGITVFFGVLATVFVGGCFFKYPDTVDTSVTVTTEHPPVWMVARGSGKIKAVYQRDRDSVRVGEVIAVLENPACTEDVLSLKERLEQFDTGDSAVLAAKFPEKAELGSIQAAYAAFLRSLTDYRNFITLNLYSQKAEATVRELTEYRNYIGHLDRQVRLDKQQAKIAETVHRREKGLFDKGLTAQAEYEEAQQALLNKQQGTEQLLTSLSNARIQEARLEQALIETRMEQERERNTLLAALKSACNDLKTDIGEWELAFLFASPANGILSYNNIWQKNQHVNASDRVFSVVERDMGRIIGKLKLPAEGAGKVRPEQTVNISVAGYPQMEFGFLTGQVESISLLPDGEGMYTATVTLPQDLRTSYGKLLDFRGELAGTAQVMTDERSLTERMMSPLRYLWEKYW